MREEYTPKCCRNRYAVPRRNSCARFCSRACVTFDSKLRRASRNVGFNSSGEVRSKRDDFVTFFVARIHLLRRRDFHRPRCTIVSATLLTFFKFPAFTKSVFKVIRSAGSGIYAALTTVQMF